MTIDDCEIGKRGAIDVLRKGVEHGPVHFVENESFERFVGDMVYAITNP